LNKRSLENKLYNNRYSAFRQYGFTENETQQIIHNQAIVEKIQNEISKEPRAYISASYLQKILDTTHHSKCFGGDKNE